MMNFYTNPLTYSMESENPYHKQNWATAGLMTQSKKIQKIKLENYPQSKNLVKEEETSDHSEKLLLKTGYDTYLPGEREQILNSIKSRILEIENLNLRLEENNSSAPEIDWVQHIKWLNFRDFNNVILEVIPSYKPYLSLDHQNLTQLRKKIKSWFKSHGKVETRGAPLILESELSKFIKATKEVLRSMKYRSFEDLRSKMIPIIQKIHSETGRSFKGKNIFSKHFWCDFTNKHTEIGNLWKDLPRSKSKKIDEEISLSPEENLTPDSNISVKLEQDWNDKLDELQVKTEE